MLKLQYFIPPQEVYWSDGSSLSKVDEDLYPLRGLRGLYRKIAFYSLGTMAKRKTVNPWWKYLEPSSSTIGLMVTGLLCGTAPFNFWTVHIVIQAFCAVGFTPGNLDSLSYWITPS